MFCPIVADYYSGMEVTVPLFAEISVAGNAERILVTSRFDNLGNGASGAAIQNMNLVAGRGETTGLSFKL